MAASLGTIATLVVHVQGEPKRAQIVLRESTTSKQTVVETDNQGYAGAQLAPGTYQLTVQRAGRKRGPVGRAVVVAPFSTLIVGARAAL